MISMIEDTTACVVAVIALRKREQRAASAAVVDVTPIEKPPVQIGGGGSDQGTLPR